MTRGSNTRCHLMRLTREIKCTRRCTSFYQGRSAQNRIISVTSLCASSSVMKSCPAKVVLVVDRSHNIVLEAGLVIFLLLSKNVMDTLKKLNELATASVCCQLMQEALAIAQPCDFDQRVQCLPKAKLCCYQVAHTMIHTRRLQN